MASETVLIAPFQYPPNPQPPATAGEKVRPTRRPSRRNCRIYERAMFEGETYEAIAASLAVGAAILLVSAVAPA
ncbi:MAG TPA: hypothetical protein VF278_04895 [Pirellulales bacterium]